MATILDLARHADVSAENVLRVVRGDPVSTEISERVNRAIDELGFPTRGGEPIPGPRSDLVRAREELVSLLERAGDVGLNGGDGDSPEGGTNALVEAVRGEVRPVSTEVARLGLLFDWISDGINELKRSSRTDRVERIEDLELMIDLLTTGWRTVDRRLGRVELALGRIETKLDR